MTTTFRHWSADDVETLCSMHARGMRVSDIAAVLDRTIVAVNLRIRSMRLERRRKLWAGEDEETLIRLHAEEVPFEDIATRLGRTTASVKKHAFNLGLTGRKGRKHAPDDKPRVLSRTSRTPVFDEELGPALACTHCRELWPVDCFARLGEDGYQSWCRACNTEWQRKKRSSIAAQKTPQPRQGMGWYMQLQHALFQRPAGI